MQSTLWLFVEKNDKFAFLLDGHFFQKNKTFTQIYYGIFKTL